MSFQHQVYARDLIKIGAHYGHKKKLWNPKMSPYIYGIRGNIHIINLELTAKKLNEALNIFYNIAVNHGRILFVNTKKQSSDIVKDTATRCGQYYINHRWLGGILTNWKTISSSIKTLKKYETILEHNNASLTKKELLDITRKKEKIDRAIGGIRNLGGMPDVLFINDVKMHNIAIKEAKLLNIPIIAIVDTNSSPDGISIVIPGNDDSQKSISFFSNAVADAIIAGMQNSNERIQQTSQSKQSNNQTKK